MTTSTTIISTEPTRLFAPGPGEIVTTSDGQRWLHPYSGAAPVRLADAPQVTAAEGGPDHVV